MCALVTGVQTCALPIFNFRDMIAAAPQLVRYEAYRSVYSIVSRYVRDDRLREALSFHTLLVGGNPMKTSAIYALIHALEKQGGVWFPRGGTHALVRGLEIVRAAGRERVFKYVRYLVVAGTLI